MSKPDKDPEKIQAPDIDWFAERMVPWEHDDICIHDDGDGLEIVFFPDRAAQEKGTPINEKLKFMNGDSRHAIAALALQFAAVGGTLVARWQGPDPMDGFVDEVQMRSLTAHAVEWPQ